MKVLTRLSVGSTKQGQVSRKGCEDRRLTFSLKGPAGDAAPARSSQGSGTRNAAYAFSGFSSRIGCQSLGVCVFLGCGSSQLS